MDEEEKLNERKARSVPLFQEAGILTATSDVDEQIAFEDGASLEHLSRSDRINGLCLLFFLHTLGQGPSQRIRYMLLKIKQPNTLRAESVFLF